MKQLAKRFFALALILALVLSLTACGGFDAASYVQGNLDANFKGVVSDSYVKQVDSDEATILAQYEQTLDSFVDSEISSQDLTRDEITDECYENIRGFYKELLNSLKYTVGKSTKTSDGFDVELTCEAINFSEQLNEADFSTAMNDILAVYMQKETMTDDDYIQLYSDLMNKYIDLYYAALSNASYSPAEAMTLHLEMENNVVAIPDSEYVAIQNALIH